jgi:CDP-4-dehydro-6-deoxyglucose reductase
MTHKVKLLPSGHEFVLEGSETVFDAAMRAGVNLNYNCASGNCGLCKARLVSGRVEQVRSQDFALSAAEKAGGYLLVCTQTAKSDVVLEAPEAHSAQELPYQEIAARVKNFSRLSEDVALLRVQTPRTSTLRFMAGQRAGLAIQGVHGERPIASCPCDGRNLQFILRRNPTDALARFFFAKAKPGQPLTVSGPSGDFVLREDSTAPLLFAAFDDGFAPVSSLIAHAVAMDQAPHFHLCWIASREEGHYLESLCRSWRDALDNFTYLQLVAKDTNEVLARIEEHCSDLGAYDVYLAGPEGMLEALADGLRNKGAVSDRIRVEFVD